VPYSQQNPFHGQWLPKVISQHFDGSHVSYSAKNDKKKIQLIFSFVSWLDLVNIAVCGRGSNIEKLLFVVTSVGMIMISIFHLLQALLVINLPQSLYFPLQCFLMSCICLQNSVLFLVKLIPNLRSRWSDKANVNTHTHIYACVTLSLNCFCLTLQSLFVFLSSSINLLFLVSLIIGL
jgi:hypothetical protein